MACKSAGCRLSAAGHSPLYLRQNRWTSTQDDIDTRQATTCANIKLANVELYTIQLNTGGDPTSTMLQTCASSTDKFYLLTAADQMTATFNTIGTNLTKLRVAQ